MQEFTVSHTTPDGETRSAKVKAETLEEAQQKLVDDIRRQFPDSQKMKFNATYVAPNGREFNARVAAFTQEEANEKLAADVARRHPFAMKQQNPYDANNPYAPDESDYKLPQKAQAVVDTVKEKAESTIETGTDLAVATAVGFSDVGGNIMDATADVINVFDEDNAAADILKEQVARQRETAVDLMDTTSDSPYAAMIGRMAPTMAAYVGGGGALFKGMVKAGTSGWSAGVMSGIITDQMFANVNDNLGNVVQTYVPEQDRNAFYDAVALLAANPDDTVAEKRLKLLIEGAVTGGVFGIFFDTPLLAKTGVNIKRAGEWSADKIKSSENVDKLTSYIKDQVRSFQKEEILTPVEEVLNKHKMIPTPPSQVARQADNYWTSRMLDTTFTRNGFWTADAHNGFEGAEHAIRQNMSEMKHITGRMKTAIDRAVQQGPWNSEEITGWVKESLTEFGEFKNKDEMWAVIQHRYNLPADLVDEIVDARTLLDDLAKKALDLDVVDPGLKEILNENMGSWIRRSYQMFEGDWTNNNELQQAALDSIASRLKHKSMDDRMLRAAEILQGVMDDASGKEAAEYFTTARKLNKKIFKKREELDPAMREWMGEITNPTDNLLLSVQKLSTFVHKAKFYDDLYKVAKDDYILEHAHGNFNKVIQGTGTNLDGMFTSQGILDAMRDRQGSWLDVMAGYGEEPGILTQMWRGMLLTKGAVQKGKTIYSHQTHIRNALGGMQMVMANGFNPIDIQDALSIVKNELAAGGDKALDSVYEELVGRGVINTSVRANELRKVIDEGMNIFKSKHPAGQSSLVKKISESDTMIEDIYMATDDVFKITAFFKELDVLKQAHPEKSLDEVKDLAASIVKNTMPNYDRVPPGIKALRELPLGNFVAFPAEIFRTSGHVIAQGVKEITSGNEVLVARGMKRLGGYLGSMSMWGLAGTMSARFLGLSEEEQEALDVITRPQNWDTTSTKIYMRDSDTGDVLVNDTYNLNAYSFIKELYAKPVSAIMRGVDDGSSINKIIGEAAVEFIDSLTEPFVSQSIITEALVNDIGVALMSEDGKTPEGKQLFPKGASVIDNTTTALGIIFDAVKPGSLQSLETLYSAYDGEIDFNTQEPKYNPNYEAMANFTGVKFRKVNPSKSLISSLYKYKRDSSNRVSPKPREAASAQEYLEQYIESNRAEYDIQKELYRMAKAVELMSGRAEALKLLKDSKFGVGEDKAINILHGKFTPVTMPENVIQDILKNKYPELSPDAPALYSSLFRVHYGLMNTSLASFKDEQNEEGEYSERARLLRAEGGLVTDPAMRRDPYTGRPYAATAKDLIDPLQRLGFVQGGYVRQQYSLGGQVLKGIFKTAGRQAPKAFKDKSVFRASESLAANPLTREDLYRPTKVSFMTDNIQQDRFDEADMILGDEHTIFDMTDPAAAENLKAIGYEPQEGAAFVSIKKKHDGEEIPMFFQDEDEILEFYNVGVGKYDSLRSAKHSAMDAEFSKTWRAEDDLLAYPFIDPVKATKTQTDLDEDQFATIVRSLYDPNETDTLAVQYAQASPETKEFIKENIKPVSKDVVRRVRMSEPEGITVFHGSSADFDKFSRDFDFTGEGNQAYGAGAYFTETEDIAKTYRDLAAFKNVKDADEDSTARAYTDQMDMTDQDAFLEEIDIDVVNTIDIPGSKMKFYEMKDGSAIVHQPWKKNEPFRAIEMPPVGNMYQVRLNIKPDELLVLDEKLVKTENGRKLIQDYYDETEMEILNSITGQDLIDDAKVRGTNSIQAISDEIQAAGFKGIKYKDGFSRGKEGGTYNYVVFDPDRDVTILKNNGENAYKKKFLRGSTVKIPVFRATTGDEPTTDLLIAIVNPRELGVHVGANAGQANVIARPGAQKFIKKQGSVDRPAQMSEADYNEMNFFTDPDQTYGTVDETGNKISKGTAPDATISEYYINIKNPLKVRDIGRWGAEDLVRPLRKGRPRLSNPVKVVRDMTRKLNYYDEFGAEGDEAADKVNLYILAKLTDDSALGDLKSQLKADYIDIDYIDEQIAKFAYQTPGDGMTKRAFEFQKAIENQLGRPISTEEWDKLDSIFVPDEEILDADVIDDIVHQAGVYRANRQFREWLKDFGFDSIEYVNTGEASFEGADQRSWIIFDHSQIKSARAESFDITDPRVSKAMGGLVRNRDKYAQGGMVPMPPEVMQPEAQGIINPPLNQSNLQVGEQSDSASIGTGLIMRSLKRRFR